MEDEKQVVKTDAAQYTLLPGETVLLELKVKEFGDDGGAEIVVSEDSKNPLSALLAMPSKIIDSFLKPIKKLFGGCTPAEISVTESGSFVVTNMRCFIAKAVIGAANIQKKSCIQSALAAGFSKESYAFTAFPRSVLTEYNSFTCEKDFATNISKSCCCSSIAQAISYKTVLTIGLNTKGENSAIEPDQHLTLTLDPAQVANHEQALAVISKLSELAQKAN